MQAVGRSEMYRNVVQGRSMLCSVIEVIKGGLYLGLDYSYSFCSCKLGGIHSLVLIIYNNKQYNSYISNIYFVQTRHTLNS